MSDDNTQTTEENKPSAKKAPKTYTMMAIRKFGHPAGKGTVNIGDVITLTGAQVKSLPKGCVELHVSEDEDDD